MIRAFLTALTIAASAPAYADADLISVARGAGDLSTFLALAEAAGVADNLATEGPFTIFVPSDTAFAALPPGTVEALMRTGAFAEREAMVTGHILPGIVSAADMLYQDYAAGTLGGTTIVIDGRDGTVTFGGAHVIKGDIEAGNGMIHVIDRVVMPE